MSDNPRMERRVLIGKVGVGILHATPEGQILRCTAPFADIIGYGLEEVPGLTLQEITAPEDLAANAEALHLLSSAAPDSVVFETRFIRKDGSLTWLKLTVSLQRNGEGPAFHLLIFVEDVNLRNACEAGLARNLKPTPAREARYLNVFQTCPDAVLIARLSDGRIIDANQAFLDVMGFASGE